MINFKTKVFIASAGILILGSMMPLAFANSYSSASSNSSINVIVNNNPGNFPFLNNTSFDDFILQFFGRRLRANMDGSQEIPGPGDPDATGKAKVKLHLGRNELCIDIQVENIESASAAHIHHAPAGSAGAVVVVLPIPNANGEAKGCIIGVSNDLLLAIKDNPQDYYVNVHNNPYPNGALRGQLFR